jgi:hypothetical protein
MQFDNIHAYIMSSSTHDILINGNAEWQSAAAFMMDQNFERDALSIKTAPQSFATGRPQYIVGVHKRTGDLSARCSSVPAAVTFIESAREEYVAIKFTDDVGVERMFIRRTSIAMQAYASERARSCSRRSDGLRPVRQPRLGLATRKSYWLPSPPQTRHENIFEGAFASNLAPPEMLSRSELEANRKHALPLAAEPDPASLCVWLRVASWDGRATRHENILECYSAPQSGYPRNTVAQRTGSKPKCGARSRQVSQNRHVSTLSCPEGRPRSCPRRRQPVTKTFWGAKFTAN